MTPSTLSRAELVAELLAPPAMAGAAQILGVGDAEPAYGSVAPRDVLLARKLGAARELLLRDLQAQMRKGPVLESPQAIRDWLRLYCAGLEHEVFLVLYLSVNLALIEAVQLFRGTLTQTSVYPRELVKGALARNCAALIVAHNHPGSGSVEPSRADKHLTQSLRAALTLVDVRLIDHFIVSGDRLLSFAERGLL